MQSFRCSLQRHQLLRSACLAIICIAGCNASKSTTAPTEVATTQPAPTDFAAPSSEAAGDLPANFAVLSDGLRTSGQPTVAQLDALAQSGLTTVINLQAEDESGVADEKMAAAALGLRYLELPTRGAEDISRHQAQELATLLANADVSSTLLHCASSNRVGALLALGAYYLQGADVEQAIALGKQAGMTRLEEKVREVIAQDPR